MHTHTPIGFASDCQPVLTPTSRAPVRGPNRPGHAAATVISAFERASGHHLILSIVLAQPEGRSQRHAAR